MPTTPNYKILNSGYSNNDKVFVKAKGNYLFDDQGVQYFDLAMGAGSLVFGHTPEVITEAISHQAKLGSIYLQNNSSVQELSLLVSERIPKELSNHVYCNSGSEATQRAVRLARAATGKMKIASFHGGWHGMNEWTLLDNGGRFDSNVKPYTGIPPEVLKYSVLLPYNTADTWAALDENSSELAAVIVEPLQGSNPQPQIASFLTDLMAYCKKKKILIIFDEIITGFRLHPGGASKFFNLVPDIATYGKVLGGGLPIGLLTFNQNVFDDTFAIPEKTMLTGGTFSANPFITAAGAATLKNLTSDVYTALNLIGDNFRKTMNQALQAHAMPLRADGVGSISRLYFTTQPIKNREERDRLEMSGDVQKKFRMMLQKKNILWPTNGILCHPTCFSEQDATYIVQTVIQTLTELLKPSHVDISLQR